jgi:outer membrane protein insertion porin family
MWSLRPTVLIGALAINGLTGGATLPAAFLHPEPATQDKAQDEKKWAHIIWADVEFEFEGNKVFTSEALLKVAKKQIEWRETRSKAFNDELLEYILKVDVVNFMRNQGYLQARIGEPKLLETEKGLRITASVEEGMRYRLGEIKIEGAKRFSATQIREMLDLQAGEVADGFALNKALNERIKKPYGDDGYIQYLAVLEPHFRSALDLGGDGIVDFTVTIMEGKPFVISRIEFIGNARTPDYVLQNALHIKEDETFSQQKFEESFKSLNALGLFEPVDEGDAELRTDEETAELFIRIRLKEK